MRTGPKDHIHVSHQREHVHPLFQATMRLLLVAPLLPNYIIRVVNPFPRHVKTLELHERSIDLNLVELSGNTL